MAGVRIALPSVARRVVAASQSWNWLTERCKNLPQLRLVFDGESPQSIDDRKKFVYP
ncbi:hypothetical protein SAMN05444050_1279 [Afipia sp. GAS231]|nr:hypothetical protein SAMN05444050_1279 [Afipia sp. GAS231]